MLPLRPAPVSRRLATLSAALLLTALACSLPFGGQPTAVPPTAVVPTVTPPPAGGIVTISEVKNGVETSNATGAQWVPAAEGQTLGVGGGARTNADGRARLDTTDATLVRLDGGTTLAFPALPGGAGGADTRLSLQIGQLWALVSDAPGAGKFEVETPGGVVSAERGALVNVSYYPDTGRVVVTCLAGVCRLTGPNGGFVDIGKGQQTEIPEAGQDPVAGGPMDGAQLSGWIAEVPEAQPVAAEITPAPSGAAGQPPQNLGQAGGNLTALRLAFDGQGVLHLVWRSDSARPSGDIFHLQLPPGGQWSAPETLTASFEYLDTGPQLLFDAAGSACVLWTGGPTTGDTAAWGLYETCQGGAGWSDPQRLTADTGEAPAAFAPDGTVQALSYGRLQGVSYAGVSLSGDESAVTPQFVIDTGGAYHALWTSLGDPYLVVQRASADGGASWAAEEPVSDSATLPSGLELAAIADAAGDIHVAWPGSGISYRRWSPAAGWDPLQTLPSGGGGLRLAADPSGRAWLTWAGGGQVSFAHQDSAFQFGAPQTIGALGANNPVVAVDGQGAGYLLWVEEGNFWYSIIPGAP